MLRQMSGNGGDSGVSCREVGRFVEKRTRLSDEACHELNWDRREADPGSCSRTVHRRKDHRCYQTANLSLSSLRWLKGSRNRQIPWLTFIIVQIIVLHDRPSVLFYFILSNVI